MVLTKILKTNAKKYANSLALTMRMGFRTVNMTYREVYDVSRKIALLLEQEGVGRGDKVLLLAPNSPYWICSFWGCLLRGAVAVPLNIQSTPELIEKIAKETEAKLFLAYRYYKNASPNNIKRYDLDVIKEFLNSFDPEKYRETEVNDDDLVEILYTSGTTGDPKGVMLTHANLYSNIRAISQILSIKKGKERFLSILPLSHILEQAFGFLLPFSYGKQIIYAHSLAAIRDLLKKHKITKMLAVPEFLKLMMVKIEDEAEQRGRKKLLEKLMRLSLRVGSKRLARILFYSIHKNLGGKLDTTICGGAPLDPVLEKKWNSLGVFLIQGYGLTETSPLVTANSYDQHKFGSVGKVVPGVQVRITSAGQVEVKGPNVFQGYFKDEQKTKEVFTDDGWFQTGDMGELDPEGFLFLKGRKKYMILGSGGQNVFPDDLESALKKVGGFKDCTVVGVSTKSGQTHIHAVFLGPSSLDTFSSAKALENTRDERGVQSIVDKANASLASYQQITEWSVWPETDFPRTSTRKVKKNEILKFLEEQRESDVVAVPMRRDPLLAILSQLDAIPQNKITQETTISQFKFDSLTRVELIARIEEEFGILIDETKLKPETTVAQLQAMIEEKESVKPLPPLKSWPRWFWVRWLRVVAQEFLFLFARTFIKLRVHGLENIIGAGLKGIDLPVVFMPNHTTYIDPFVVAMALPRSIRHRLAFAAANDVLYGEYRHFSQIAEFLFQAFPFPRKEGENIKLGLDYMGQLIDKNLSITIFPEGKMSESGELLPLKRGAGLVAVEMDVLVVPVTITGANVVLPYDKFLPRRRGAVTVTFGKPLKFKRTDSYVRATDRIQEALAK